VNAVSTHVRSWRGRLAVTYALVTVENTLELLYPFAIGLAVDGLLDGSYGGVAVFAVISLTHTGVSFGRQRYDARSFARLNLAIADDLVERQRRAGVPTTSIAARTNLAAEYVGFLELDVPLAITAVFAVFGSLAMLTLYDPWLGLVAATVIIPVAVLNRRLMRRSATIYRELNDQTELEVAVIGSAPQPEVRRHFQIINRHWVHLSDAEATSWGLVEVIAAGLAVFALIRSTDTGAAVGTIFATVAYVWAYIGGFDQIPGVLQRMASLGDIRRRLDDLDGTDGTDDLDDLDGPEGTDDLDGPHDTHDTHDTDDTHDTHDTHDTDDTHGPQGPGPASAA
jgi:ABC-type multidrug transport system fused ATPase/permease subunit